MNRSCHTCCICVCMKNFTVVKWYLFIHKILLKFNESKIVHFKSLKSDPSQLNHEDNDIKLVPTSNFFDLRLNGCLRWKTLIHSLAVNLRKQGFALRSVCRLRHPSKSYTGIALWGLNSHVIHLINKLRTIDSCRESFKQLGVMTFLDTPTY